MMIDDITVPKKYRPMRYWVSKLTCPEMKMLKIFIKLEDRIRSERIKKHEKKIQNQ